MDGAKVLSFIDGERYLGARPCGTGGEVEAVPWPSGAEAPLPYNRSKPTILTATVPPTRAVCRRRDARGDALTCFDKVRLLLLRPEVGCQRARLRGGLRRRESGADDAVKDAPVLGRYEICPLVATSLSITRDDCIGSPSHLI